MLQNTETDNFGFKVTSKQKPMAKRTLLSIISSVYDLLRIAAPFLLQERLLNQELCRADFGLDDLCQRKPRYSGQNGKRN